MCLCYLFSAKTARQVVNRKVDFLQNESILIDSHNESNRLESRIGMLYYGGQTAEPSRALRKGVQPVPKAVFAVVKTQLYVVH